jgi:uncharacterized Zn-finger protein
MCEVCRKILEKFYKFKQICKRSDTMLKMYPMTGVIPPKMQIPPELLDTPPESPKPIIETSESTTQTEEDSSLNFSFLEDNNIISSIITPQDIQLIEMEEQKSIEPEKIEEQKITKPIEPVVKTPKILNKSKTDSSKPPKYFKKPAPKVEIKNIEIIKPLPKILNSEISNITKVEKQPENVIEFLEVDEESVPSMINVDQMSSEDGENVYVCDVCDKTFPLLQQLEIHKLNHTRSRDHPCSLCDKSFFSKYDLGKHMLTHTQQRDYTCVVCNKSFSRSTLLYRHEKIHTSPDIPRYNCDKCDRVYLNILDFEKHSTTHQKSRPFQCKYCDKSFVFKQGLERHETVHDTRSMAFTCQYCHSKFPTAAQLQRHLGSDHLGEKKFPCRFCTKRFTLSHHLHRHLRSSHKNEEFRSYKCSVCGDFSTSRAAFFVHSQEHASESLSCPLCECELSMAKVAEHMSNHASANLYLCDHCSLVYVQQDDLDSHLNEVHADEAEILEETEIEYIMSDDKNDEGITFGEEEVTFVEYVESDVVDDINIEPPVKKSKKITKAEFIKKENSSKTIMKLTREKIEQLKKEGKIEYIDGEMVMSADMI